MTNQKLVKPMPATIQDALYFLSPAQASLVARHPEMAAAVHEAGGMGEPESQSQYYGCYVPHRVIAKALGFSPVGINQAVNRFGPYVWATEFENVHSYWSFTEPGFVVDGIRFNGPEQFCQLHKVGDAGSPAFGERCTEFAKATEMEAYVLGQSVRLPEDWEYVKDKVMRAALRHKFDQSDELKQLLLVTHPHPLVSVKSDPYWGTGNDGQGLNRLGTLLMELREEYLSKGKSSSNSFVGCQGLHSRLMHHREVTP